MLKKLPPQHGLTALNHIEQCEGEDVAKQLAAKAGISQAPKEWQDLLRRREWVRAPLDKEEAEEYKEAVRKDRQLVRRKILCTHHKGKHGTKRQEKKELEEVQEKFGPLADIAENDAGLPTPSNPVAQMVELWCKHGSWGICAGCGSVQPRPLQPSDLKKVAKPTISVKACTACSKGEYVPCLKDVPEPLRHLPPTVLLALRPLDVDTGTPIRALHGYRAHTKMITFAWATMSVDDKIKALRTKAERKKGRAALQHLKACRNSNYFSFYEKHLEFLERHGTNAWLNRRERPLKYIEQEGRHGQI